MEISSYRILIAAANATGSSDVAAMSERMLAEKEEFAEWVDQQIPILTAEFLRRDETADATAAPSSCGRGRRPHTATAAHAYIAFRRSNAPQHRACRTRDRKRTRLNSHH